MNGEKAKKRVVQHEHARLAFRLTAVATISRDARNTNPPEEEEAGISSFPQKSFFCVCVFRGDWTMCSSFASKAFEEIDFWREREVQKQPWCDDDDDFDDDDAEEERAAFVVAHLLAFERFFFLFFLPAQNTFIFLYFNIKP